MMPDFQTKLAAGYYEKATRNGYRRVFTSIDVSSLIWRKVKRLQLSSSYIKKPC